MSLIVQKFGGTSVGSPERIRAVAALIAETCAAGHSVVVVVSAMGHTTDELITLARQVSQDPPHREMDMLLTAGERISMALLSMALGALRVPAISLTGSQSGIITDGAHRRARIQKILGDRIRKGIEAKKVVIVAGFQGVSPDKEITTLGRGGSDTTAVALAAALQADQCDIYTDVDGVFTADPRIVKSAKHLPRIPAPLMTELSVLGAQVLHPRSVQLANQFGVKLRVLNSLKMGRHTEIVAAASGDATMEEFKITGVTQDPSKVLIRAELMRASVQSALWDQAAKLHLAVVAPHFVGQAIEFFADLDSEGDWKKVFSDLTRDGFVHSWTWSDDWVPLSVVGFRLSQDGRAMAEILDVLASQSIAVHSGKSSSLSATFAVPRNRSEEALEAVHKHFFSHK